MTNMGGWYVLQNPQRMLLWLILGILLVVLLGVAVAICLKGGHKKRSTQKRDVEVSYESAVHHEYGHQNLYPSIYDGYQPLHTEQSGFSEWQETQV